jgi:alpha-1,6-mannosyltransferase
MELARPGTAPLATAAIRGTSWASLARSSWARVVGELGPAALLGGFAASLTMALSGSPLLVGYDGPTVRWWFGPALPPRAGQLGNYLVCYAGMIGLSTAWLLVLRRLRRGAAVRPLDLIGVGSLWSLPLLVGPPLFSRDVYSYLAQGTLAHLQLSPYQYPPAVLGAVGFGNVLSAVSPVWRLTTVPYGPVFVWLSGVVAGLSGGHIDLAAVLFRLPELAGVGLAAACLPRLARHLGADPRQAVWLGAASPLVLFELLSAGHNDALMVGVVVAGLLAAMEGWPLAGVALCSLGTLVKLPALAGAVFIAWAWARERPGTRAKLASLGRAAGVSAATLLAGSGLTSGFGWVSTKLLLVPDKVATPISLSKAFSSVLQLATEALGLGSGGSLVPQLVRGAGLALGGVALLVVLARTRKESLVPSLGLAMVVLVIAGTDAWPWYLTWGVVPLATWRPAQGSWLLVAAVALFDFVVTPAGQLVLPDAGAPAAAAAWAALAVAVYVTTLRPRSAVLVEAGWAVPRHRPRRPTPAAHRRFERPEERPPDPYAALARAHHDTGVHSRGGAASEPAHRHARDRALPPPGEHEGFGRPLGRDGG